MKEKKQKKISIDIVVPIYDEADVILEFHSRLISIIDKLPQTFRIYYINDGSSDNTMSRLLEVSSQDGRVTIVELSRNFGHQAALTAGMDLAEGDLVITMDGDGQHSPEMIPALIDQYHKGYDIVQTIRVDDQETPFYKRISAKFFYWLINKLGNTKIIPGSADFRLMTHPVVLSLRSVTEYNKFIRGIIPWLGYHVYTLPYTPQKRISGKSKYSITKMFTLAENAIFSFSLVPLRIGLLVSCLFFIMAIIEAIYVLSFWITGNKDSLVPGWSSTIFLVLITGGSLMFMISLVGIYVVKIAEEVKKRPVYIIRTIFHNGKSKSKKIP